MENMKEKRRFESFVFNNGKSPKNNNGTIHTNVWIQLMCKSKKTLFFEWLNQIYVQIGPIKRVLFTLHFQYTDTLLLYLASRLKNQSDFNVNESVYVSIILYSFTISFTLDSDRKTSYDTIWWHWIR